MPIENGTHFVYTVQQGDNLYSIANRLGSRVADIERANGLYPPFTDPGLINPGQLLVVTKPGGNQTFQIVATGDTLTSFAQRYAAGTDLLFGINPQLGNPNLIYVNQTVLVPAFVYEVAQGDTLTRIAQQFGTSVAAILRTNQGRPALSADVIYPGYRLLIPHPSSSNIVVFRPIPGTTIQQGQTLSGYARAFEGAILYQIVDDAGTTVTNESPIQASEGGPAFGTFSIPIRFNRTPQTSTGQLRVYSRSANDGSIQDLVRVRILF
ncbi:LysM peptidoglycan-binding domain-containing protein [Jeotgalibacillus proteolyticus]|uniref:LysM domain-containing protein n=1 Tax=Jeotgalibacillus proteolyticus TaxID=2082395 RepID=A0A2S5GD44_9BACL|nr:LysM peptidoglycan-binding domain-containing protein [Jeotgalibacillus proteolyticus]PPA70823.1 hypothetical protein C4B60_08500 [Jeotgalibacillus proteolyticus]